ncbi:alpha/beta fold hydrolase [Archangium primigenium]|uniref:alpha/beta fold hydrolase n=1 Tax=[Archangium] primigenium TaxID=2792470 RepID=UPI001959CD3D|nr:alpha/beta hydrolase [Archangium primigenium]MBM7118587.1 alpha/beta hydrolase [Archangium primigenium]
MRREVELKAVAGRGPRVLLLPGLGARGSGFEALAERLSRVARPVLVEYPEGPHAARGAGALAREVLAAAGAVDAVVASSFGGMVAAHLALAGAVRGVAFLGSFTRPEHLGPRGHLLPIMGPLALLGRPGPLTAALASWRPVAWSRVPEVVPTTRRERMSTWHRAFAIPREPPPAPLNALPVTCVCIQGSHDVLVPAASMARLAASLPPGTPQHLLRGAGHVPYFTHPDDCARLLTPWLAALPAAE